MSAQQEWRNAVRDSGLPASTKLVAFVLDTFMDANGTAWPARETLADAAGVSLSTVDRAMSRLRAAGLVAVRKGHGRGHVNLYRAITRPVDNHSVKGVTSDKSGKEKASNRPVKGVTSDTRTRKRTRNARARAREAAFILERVQVDQAMLELARGWLTKQ